MVFVHSYETSIFQAHATNYAKKMSKTPIIDISINPRQNKSQIYTTGSAVAGKAIITSSSCTQFDEIQITLEGQTRVSLEQMSQVAGHSTIEASHTFLKLTMPIPDTSYPHPRLLEADEPISVPFNFCIPAHLLPQSCTHKCIGDHVHDAHVQLPPTMDGANDHTPDMGRVHYFIAVKLLKKSCSTEKSQVLTTAVKKFKVLPNFPELPPLHIEAAETEFQLSRTKNLKKGMFKGKLGQITFTANQPKPFVISLDSISAPSITAPVTLQFHPTTPSSSPPKIGTLTTKIKTSTYASVKAQKDLARKLDLLTNFDPTRGIYTQSTTLATMTLDSTTSWKYVADAPIYARRDSGYETCSDSSDDTCTNISTSSTTGHYEAEILVPLSLPTNKSWLPTFHSCLVSRVYSLEVNVSVSSGGSALPTSMTLRLPVQVAASSTEDAQAELEMESIVDEALRPRVMSVPDARFVQRSSIPGVTPEPQQALASDLPPGYAGGLESYVRRESAAEGILETGFE